MAGPRSVPPCTLLPPPTTLGGCAVFTHQPPPRGGGQAQGTTSSSAEPRIRVARHCHQGDGTYFSTTVPILLQASSAASRNAGSGWAIFTKSACSRGERKPQGTGWKALFQDLRAQL